MTEHDIVAGQKLFIEKIGGAAYLINQSRGKTHSYTTPGVSDMVILVGERIIFNEVKDGGNLPEPAQQEFGRQVIKNGGLWVVTRSVDDLMQLGADLGIWRW